MNPDRIAETARLLGEARLKAEIVPEFDDRLRPDGEAEGYAVQAALGDWFQAHGQGDLVGYKIGATTEGMQRYLGVAGPVFGRIRAANVHASPATLRSDGLFNPGIECEIAFRLAEDGPEPGKPISRDALVGKIDAVLPAIEIVENRYGDFLSRGIGMLAADDFFHKACVLGAPVTGWRELDLKEARGRMTIDATEVATGVGAAVLDDPLNAVLWLADALAKQGETLRTGQIVLTGSMTPVHWIENIPSAAGIEIGGLGACTVTLG